MPKLSTLNELLAGDVVPRPSSYEEVINKFIRNAEDGTDWNHDQDALLLRLSLRSYRLIHFFRRVHTYQATHPFARLMAEQ